MEDKHPLDFELGAGLCKSFWFSDKKSGVHDWYVKEKLALPASHSVSKLLNQWVNLSPSLSNKWTYSEEDFKLSGSEWLWNWFVNKILKTCEQVSNVNLFWKLEE